MQEKKVTSGTATLYVRVSGPATAERALIVIAGGPGASHHYIRALEQMANDKRRVVLFDQRGVGSSTAPVDGGIPGVIPKGKKCRLGRRSVTGV